MLKEMHQFMKKNTRSLSLVSALAATLIWISAQAPVTASDHQDAPNLSSDLGADINDGFLFLDPNDNTYVILGMTLHGFIVPGEALNFSYFDPHVIFRFLIENTGDAKPDMNIDVQFGTRTSTTTPQMATISLPKRKTFMAPSTPPTIADTAEPQTITTDPNTGVSFFAGEVDDPFFFDIPAFDRFVSSVKAGTPDPTVFNRGRDSFAGYNTLSIALRIPVAMLIGHNNPVIGMATETLRRAQTINAKGEVQPIGPEYQVDRAATPAVNVALIPFDLKNEYNASTPQEDAAGKFVTPILATLHLFGTDAAHIATLANIAVNKGDYLRVNTTIANTGPEGGTNAGAGFPNGRRPADDTITTILTVINNGNYLSDNVPASDIPPQDEFPFFAFPQQPRDAGVVDDNTRN
jgi:hypothetical protein